MGREPSAAGLDHVPVGAQVVSGIIAASLAEVEDVVTWPQLRVLVVTNERGTLHETGPKNGAGKLL